VYNTCDNCSRIVAGGRDAERTSVAHGARDGGFLLPLCCARRIAIVARLNRYGTCVLIVEQNAGAGTKDYTQVKHYRRRKRWLS
jgi:hypothetical protein